MMALVRNQACEVQVQKLEHQSARQVEAIKQLQASAQEQEAAMARQSERLARTDGELARARVANRKLKGEYLEQTALLSGHGLALAPGGGQGSLSAPAAVSYTHLTLPTKA